MERLHEQIERIRGRLVDMGSQVEEMMGVALRALVERDDAQVAEVMHRDRAVDRLEMEIDETCNSTLALAQPTAVDMRFLVAVLKITSELERMGDCAVNIGQAARQLNKEPQLKEYVDLPRMAEMARAMVRDSLDAFVRRDAELAGSVCRADDAVDTLYRELFSELLATMAGRPETVSRCVHLLLVARNLERIADLATNVAEDVIYYVEGRDVRHGAADDD